MSVNRSYKTYEDQAITTASPGQLTLMLYDGCLKFIRLAKAALAEQDYEQKNVQLVKAQNIIRELMLTLDQEVQIAGGMMQMYDYIHRCLVEANVKSDADSLNEAEQYVTEFRDAWKEVLVAHRKQQFKQNGQV
ncbi:MAG TPA: flagellar export chaperone FliS [Bacillales bacterium]|nr:flagellar export chaperone FliS [Bacillales bacterium]